MKNKAHNKSPAKLILSGEHSVVYGKPALAMAIDKYAVTEITERQDQSIAFNFVNLQQKNIFTFNELQIFKQSIDSTKKLTNKSDLLQYTFIYLVEQLQIKFTTGVDIKVDSALPVGCGMGSSAATIVSILRAICEYYSIEISLDECFILSRNVENLQHGVSSGLDVYIALHGGCYFYENGVFLSRPLPRIPITLINSGRPLSTTGEAVQHAAKFFKTGTIGDDFAEVTTVMDLAIRDNNLLAVQQCVRENHRLLRHIGVVPDKVSAFIAGVEKLGGAAKVSGAGAVEGDNAGIIMIIGDIDIKKLIASYGYEIL